MAAEASLGKTSDLASHGKIRDLNDGAIKKIKPRSYQVELVEHALKENTIVNLGTGAGKTFVAVMLIRELSHQIQSKFTEEEGKRTVFLAHTVPLVKQQSNYVKDNTSLTVQDFFGDSKGAKGIDNWPKEKWYELFDRNNVLAMSRQIFLDILERGIIKPRQLNLIVFDECHHATKNDPYVRIMKVIQDAPPEERPRILGLSASLLGTKVKPGELRKGVVGLEQILMSRARTAKDLQDVIENATKPSEKVANYSISNDDISITLKNIVEEPLKLFQTKLSDRKVRCRLGEVAKNLFEDLLNILVDLGPASAAEFVKIALDELRKSFRFASDYDQYDYGLAVLGITHLTIFDIKCREFLTNYGKLEDSDKVKTLLLALGDISIQYSGDLSGNEDNNVNSSVTKEQKSNGLTGIIFVERRYTASCLSELLKRKRKEQQDLRHIRCDYVVGHNVGQNTTSIRKEARMKSKKQDEILSKFRSGRINILIATSVIEEGVDIPKCNLVVRFDLPQNFRAYIQSKGRARNKPSLFYLLVGENQLNKLAEIKSYHKLEEELISICQEDRVIPNEESIQAKMKDKIPPYMPYGREGARATVGNSLTILHRYCLKLPHDDYTKLSPTFEVTKLPKDRSSSITLYGGEDEEDEDPKHDYICKITLPVNCPIQDTIVSPKMGSKLQAHRAAALYAVEKLHKLGELNHLFFPVPSVDSDDEEMQREKMDPLAGTERRHWLCRNNVSSYLKNCQPLPDQEMFLYAFVLREASNNQLYSTNINSPHIVMGLLTKKQIPHWKIPKFSLFIKGDEDKEIEVYVSLMPLPDKQVFSPEKLDVLRSCHQSIFSDVLKIVPPSLEINFTESEKDYVIVPLSINRIDNDIISSGVINYDVASTISVPSECQMPSWPFDLEHFENALVSVCHREAVSLPVGEELYKVTVDHTHSPLSSFPTPQFASYKDYYESKYNYKMKDPNQPALKACGFSISSLKFLKSRYGGVSPKQDKKTHLILFPEIVKIFPISANVYRLLKCLPSILWRLESLVLVEEMSTDIQLGNLDFNTRIFTDTHLKGQGDIGYGSLPTQVLKYDGGSFLNKTDDSVQYKDLFCRGPDNGLLLQALTPKAANDSINLERLELLGDSLLKISSSIYLYNKLSNAHEAKLSSARSHRISNLKLFCQAKRKHILGNILSNDILMGSDSETALDRIRFFPPGYILKPKISAMISPHLLCPDNVHTTMHADEIKYLYHRFSDKMAADCMEALIGTCTVAGGIESGLKIMEWFDIGITTADNVKLFDGDMTVNDDTPLTIAQSSYTFRKYFGYPRVIDDVNAINRHEFNRLLSLTSGVQKIIGYQFNHHCLLFEAMTHLSYARNKLTGCYQRLEFLGDAILDYLITSHLYNLDESMTPGFISRLRSALVCNHSLAELSVGIRLHTSLQHSSPELFKKIGMYAAALKKSQSIDSMSVEEMSIEEQEDSMEDEDNDSDSESEEDDINNDVTLDPPKPLGDIFESLCGAVFLDTNMDLEKTWKVFGKFFKPRINEYVKEGNMPINPVKQLFDLVPIGIKVKRKIQRDGCYCIITIEDKDIKVDGFSKNYKNAKIIAANKALQALLPNNNTT